MVPSIGWDKVTDKEYNRQRLVTSPRMGAADGGGGATDGGPATPATPPTPPTPGRAGKAPAITNCPSGDGRYHPSMQTIDRSAFVVAILSLLVAPAQASQDHGRRSPRQETAAQDSPAAPGGGQEAAGKPKYKIVAGPTNVELGNDLTIALRDGDLFLDKENAKRFMTAAGNQPGDNLLGVVTQPRRQLDRRR